MRCSYIACVLLSNAAVSIGRADVRMPAILGDHMVLQRAAAVSIWGWADPSEAVSINVGDARASATAGADGKWSAKLEGLKASDQSVQVTIAGEDHKFFWATATIDQTAGAGRVADRVIVSSPDVKEPTAVRYGWANHPEVNLYNKEGLPASPFRTDDWSGSGPIHADLAAASLNPATFTVQDGAAPWSDRVGTWELGDIPDSLKSSDPIPQQLCGSRTLSVTGNPQSITLGVSEADLPGFKEIYPDARETGEKFTIRHPKETEGLPYVAVTLPNPPQTISGGDAAFQAGLVLLKIDGGPTTTPATRPS